MLIALDLFCGAGGATRGYQLAGFTGALATTSVEPGPAPLDPVPGHTERTGLTVGGYRCTYGTSFFMAVELTDDGPVGTGLLAYGQSGDPTSPHHVDGTEAYSAKAVRPLLFADADIEADPNLVRATVTGDEVG